MMRDCGNCVYNFVCNQQRSCLAGTQTPWHETKKEIKEGLAWGRRKAFFMRWIQTHMKHGLSPRQQEVIELHLFQGMTYGQIARMTGTHRSTVSRAVQRSVIMLRRIWKAEQSAAAATGPEETSGR